MYCDKGIRLGTPPTSTSLVLPEIPIKQIHNNIVRMDNKISQNLHLIVHSKVK